MIGNEGDYYLNVVTGDVFQKQSGTWIKIGNIKGPSFSPSTSKVRAYNNSLSQSLIKSAGWTKVYLPSKEFDTLNEFNASLYRFIASQSGYYLITGSISTTGTVSILNCAIYKNGILHSRTMSNISNPYVTITNIIYLDIGDYIEFYAYTSSTVSIAIQLGQDKLWLSICRII